MASLLMACFLTMFPVSTASAQQSPPAGNELTRPADPVAGILPRRSYVPIQELDAVTARDQQGVLLAAEEFERLYAEAKANAEQGPRIPVAITVSDADYSARIEGDHLLIHATVRLQQFATGWQSVWLPYGGLALEKATLNGQAARLGRYTWQEPPLPPVQAQQNQQAAQQKQAPQPGFVLFHNEVGPATLELDFSTVLNASGSDRMAAFRLIDAPAATLKVDVPAGRELVIRGNALDRPAPIDQPATYSLPVGGQPQVSLQFTDHQDEQLTDSLVFATTGHGLRVAPGEVTWQAVTGLQVFGTTLNQIVCTVPQSLEITDVESTGLEAWELSDDPDDAQSTLITLNYRQPFEGGREIIFRGVMVTPVGQAWAAPNLVVRNVTSHIGRVVVQHPPGVRVRLVELDGARASAGDAGTQSYDVWKEDFSLALETRTRDRDLQTTVTSLLALDSDGITFSAQTGLTSYFAPLFDVSFRLPADWEIEEVLINGQPLPWQTSSREAGWNDYQLTLPAPIPAGQTAQMVFRARTALEPWPVEDEPLELVFPRLLIPEASVMEGTFVIRAGNDLELRTTDVFGLDPAPAAGDRERLRYFFQKSDFEGLLTVSRRASRVAVETLSFTRLERETLQTALQATLEISGGGLRTLEVALSESAGTDLQFRLLPEQFGPPAEIVEQLPGETSGGLRVWTLKLDQRISGRVRLAVNAVTPRNDAQDFTPHVLTIPGADRTNGHIAIEGAPDQQITVVALDADNVPLSPVDPVDVPAAVMFQPQHRIVSAFRYTAAGYKVTLQEQRFDRVAVPTAICPHSRIHTVVGRAGEVQHRAEFQFIAVGAQSLRIVLPSGDVAGKASDPANQTELWATMIDGEPIEVRSTPQGYLVPVPAGSSADEEHELVLVYRLQTSPLTSAGHLRQQPPLVTVIHSSGTEQPLDILEQAWTLHTPDGVMLTSSAGDFAPEYDLETDSLLGRLRYSLSHIKSRQVWQQAVAAAIVLAVFGVAAMFLRRTGLSLFGCFGASAVGVVMLFITGMLMTWTLGGKVGDYADEARVSSNAYTATPQAEMGYYTGGGSASGMGGFGFTEGYDDADGPGFGYGNPAARDDPSTGVAEGGDGSMPESAETAAVDALVADAAPADAPTPAPGKPMAAAPAFAAGEPAPAEALFGTAPPTNAPGGVPGLASRRVVAETAPQPAAPSVVAGVMVNGPGSGPMPQQQAVGQPAAGEGFEMAQNRAQLGLVIDQTEEVLAEGRRGRGTTAMTGLLSLALQLEIPADARSTDFHYAGNRSVSSGVGLDVAWQDRDAAGLTCLFMAVVTTLFLWVMIRASFRARAILLTIGLALPVALISVAPAGWHAALDGIFLGSALSLLLWSVRAVLRFVCLPGLSDRLWRAAGLIGTDSAKAGSDAKDSGANSTDSKKSSGSSVSGTACLLLAASLLGMSASAVADEPAPNAQPVPPREPHGVFMPYDTEGNARDASRVLLTRDEFLRLWNQARPDQRIEAPAPLPGLIADAFYDCRLRAAAGGNGGDSEAGAVTVHATLIAYSFADGQVRLQVARGNLALTSALLDGQPAPLRTTSDGAEIVLDKPGRHTIDLTFDLPARISGPTGQFTLPVLPVPAGRVVFQLPEKELSVRVNGSTSAWRMVTTDEAQSIEIPVADGNPLTVAWRPPQQQGMVDSIVHVDSATSVLLDDVGLSQSSRVDIKVPQGSVADLSFDLPMDLRVRQISGPQLAGWELNENAGQRRLRVFFAPPITDATQLQLDLFRDERIEDANSRVSLSTAAPLEVTRDTGLIAILSPDSIGIRGGQVSGVSQVDVTQTLPVPQIASAEPAAPRIAWRYASRPFALEFIATRRQPDSVARIDHAVQVNRRSVVTASSLRATLRGAPRGTLTFELAENFVLLSVEATNMADWYVTPSDAVNPRTLTIEFDQPLLGDVQAVLSGQTMKEPADLFVELIPPRPLELGQPTGYLGVWFEDSYIASAADLAGWKQIDPSRLPEAITQQQPRPLQFAFQSSGDDDGNLLGFEIQRATPQIDADAVVITTLGDTFLSYSLALKWDIRGAAVDQFTFTTPKLLADRLTFNGGAIRQTTSEEDGDLVRWTISLQEAVRDRYFVLATATLPPETKIVTSPGVQFLQPQRDEFGDPIGFTPIENQRLYAMLLNESQLQMLARPNETSERIDANTLPITLNQTVVDRAMETYRVTDPAAGPSWQIRRLEQTTGAPASVNVADLTLVVAPDGTWRTQAVYTIRNQRRQFLGVRLPKDASLLSLFVQDQPSRPVVTRLNDEPVLLIPLPRTSAADLSFEVKLVCSGNLGQRLPLNFTLSSQEFDLPAPHVITQQEDYDYGIPVARTLWTVYLPEGVNASVVNESDRTNVTVSDEQESKSAYLRAQLLDTSSLVSIVKGKGTQVQKMVAANNLKRLSDLTENLERESSRLGREDEELQRQVADVQRELNENKRQIDLYFDNNADQDSDGVIALDDTINDVRSQSYFLNTFNRDLLVQNHGNVAGSQVSEDLNANGILDPGEDANGNGVLDALAFDGAKVQSGDALGAMTQPATPAEQAVRFGLELKSNSFAVEKQKAVQERRSSTRSRVLFLEEQKKAGAKAEAADKDGEFDARQKADRGELRKESLSQVRGLNDYVDSKGFAKNQAMDESGPANQQGGMGGGGGFGGGGFGSGSFGRQSFGGRAVAQNGQAAQVWDRESDMLGDVDFSGMPGGMGGGGMGGGEPSAWTSVGGLSLDIEIPQDGVPLRFSRVSGQPKLALSMRPTSLVETALGSAWSLVWLGIGLVLIVVTARLQSAKDLWRPMPWLMFFAGLACFVVLPLPLNALGFLAFLFGWLAILARWSLRAKPETT